jgi:hypothetical protein
MMLRVLWIFALLAALSPQALATDADDTPIIFAQKSFYANDHFVNVSGTLTGEGVGYAYNTTDISCYKDRMECLVLGIEGIGKGPQAQMSNLGPPAFFQIVLDGDTDCCRSG